VKLIKLNTKTTLATLLLVIAGLISYAVFMPEPGDELKVSDNGKAYVKGEVIENNLGCRVNVSCYFRLEVNNQNIEVVYHEGDVSVGCQSKQSTGLEEVKRGERIQAYGDYKKNGNLYYINTCGSRDYFVLRAEEAAPKY